MQRVKGSVVLDKRIKTWHFIWWQDGKRKSKRIGTKADFPSKASAWVAVKPLIETLEKPVEKPSTITVSVLAEMFRTEKMAKRHSTRRSYECWLRNFVIPRWGNSEITELKLHPVETWLDSLSLSPKSKSHVKTVLSLLWNFAMRKEIVPLQFNPMSAIRIEGVTKRRKPRSLTPEEFQKFVQHLREPFHTIAFLCVTLGLRISECLALKWSDIDWLGATLKIERGIVRSRVDTVKTDNSEQEMPLSGELLDMLFKVSRTSEFSGQDDWVFASPVRLGRLPWSYDEVLRSFQQAGKDSGVGKFGTHTMRHTYRSWLDSDGTPLGVIKQMMRHADIRTTMNVYGNAPNADMTNAHSRVVRRALPA